MSAKSSTGINELFNDIGRKILENLRNDNNESKETTHCESKITTDFQNITANKVLELNNHYFRKI